MKREGIHAELDEKSHFLKSNLENFIVICEWSVFELILNCHFQGVVTSVKVL